MRRYGILILALILIPAGSWAQSSRKRIKEGKQLYTEKKYDQALNRYQDALLSEPQNRRIQFNVANALYQKKKYEEAMQEFQKVVGTKELPLEGQTYFNLGNTLFRLGKLPESILAYQQTLKIDPNDMDAKYNLEYVRRILKQNAEKKPADQEQQSQMKPQPEENKEGDQNPEDQKQQEEQQPSPQEKKDEDKLSKEEAERILNALKNDEKELQKKRKAKVSGKTRVKKDW